MAHAVTARLFCTATSALRQRIENQHALKWHAVKLASLDFKLRRQCVVSCHTSIDVASTLPTGTHPHTASQLCNIVNLKTNASKRPDAHQHDTPAGPNRHSHRDSGAASASVSNRVAHPCSVARQLQVVIFPKQMLTTVWVLANNGKMTGIVLTMDTVRVESVASFSTRGRGGV